MEINDVKEEDFDLPIEHIEILDKRLQKVEEGKNILSKMGCC